MHIIVWYDVAMRNLILLLCVTSTAAAQEPPLRDRAAVGLRKAADFFRKEVSTEGGYLWRYSEDLKLREGEGKADKATVWVQPPGTPAVGLAFLGAYRATGDRHYLELARDAANALVKGQLKSGGWDYAIHFDPKARLGYAYREMPSLDSGKNVSTLDDNNTQAALRLLMQVDIALDRKDAAIRDAVEYGLTKLLAAQYPNGAWPQRFSGPVDPVKFPVRKANFPESWSRTFPSVDYKSFYTFNDNSIADVIDVMFLAAKLYDEPKYRKAALKGGDFMILAQLPEPQPGWAQQYNLDMQPAWARKFEPASITGGESQGVMKTLLRIFRETGDKRYLEPIPRALAYYKKLILSDGRLARFYEIGSNKPLYFTKQYELTNRDDDLPTHYGFKVSNTLDQIEKELANVDKPLPKPKPRTGEVSPTTIEQVKNVLSKLDARGRWVDDGKLKTAGADGPTRVIECTTFIRNVGILSSYLGNTKPQ